MFLFHVSMSFRGWVIKVSVNIRVFKKALRWTPGPNGLYTNIDIVRVHRWISGFTGVSSGSKFRPREWRRWSREKNCDWGSRRQLTSWKQRVVYNSCDRSKSRGSTSSGIVGKRQRASVLLATESAKVLFVFSDVAATEADKTRFGGKNQMSAVGGRNIHPAQLSEREREQSDSSSLNHTQMHHAELNQAAQTSVSSPALQHLSQHTCAFASNTQRSLPLPLLGDRPCCHGNRPTLSQGPG